MKVNGYFGVARYPEIYTKVYLPERGVYLYSVDFCSVSRWGITWQVR